MGESPQRPVEIILARRVMGNIGTPAMLVDVGGELVFFNDPAAAVLGVRFEEAAEFDAAQWAERFAASDDDGRPVPVDELPLMMALHRERPAHRRLRIRCAAGDARQLDFSAFPIVGNEGVRGAMAIFWETTDGPT